MIRKATIDDAGKVHAFLMDHFAQEAEGVGEVSFENVAWGVDECLRRGVILIAGDMKGVLGLVNNEPWYARHRVWRDLFFYVRPECRGLVSVRLLQAAMEYRPLVVSFSTGDDPNKSRFFFRMGGEKRGEIFIWR